MENSSIFTLDGSFNDMFDTLHCQELLSLTCNNESIPEFQISESTSPFLKIMDMASWTTSPTNNEITSIMDEQIQKLMESELRNPNTMHISESANTKSKTNDKPVLETADKPKKERKRKPKKCAHCGVTSAPAWRRGLDGKESLCNACGLYVKLHKKPREMIYGRVKRNPKPTTKILSENGTNSTA